MENNYIRNLKRYVFFCVMMCTAGFMPSVLNAQEAAIRTVTVMNAQGEVLPGVQIVIGESDVLTTTDDGGRFQYTAQGADIVTFSKEGYRSRQLSTLQLVENNQVVLDIMNLFTAEQDEIPLPFSSVMRRYSLGSTIVITGEELEQFGGSDIRQALTGLVAGLDVMENSGAPGMTAMETTHGTWSDRIKTSVGSRGKSLIFMLDGVPVSIQDTPLDPQQIETVSIVRDIADKALYGPFAANGIVYIRTKEGRYNSRFVTIDLEAGARTIDRMPEFVNGTDYALLNNLARHNSGIEMLYLRDDIAKYAENDPYSLFHPNVNFRNMLLKNTTNYQRINVSAGGGNQTMRYYAYIGYTGEGDIYKIGPTSNYDRLNLNSNLDIKLNSFIRAKFGFFSNMSFRRSPNYGYNSNYSAESSASNTTFDVYEFPEVISHINTIPGIAFPVYADNSPGLDAPLYAVTSNFTQNPIGNLVDNGSYLETTRKGLINLAIEMDLSFLLSGLTSRTFGSYDGTNLVRLGKAEDYGAYIVTRGIDVGGNPVPILTKSNSHTVTDMADNVKLADFFSQRFFGSQTFAYGNKFGLHDVDATLTAFITKRSVKFITEHRREATALFSARYGYNDRYLFQTSMSYSGTYSLKHNRYSFSPTFGLGWIASEEKFLSSARWLDFLKVKAQAGILYYDGSMSAYRDYDQFMWSKTGAGFGPHTNNQWFGSAVTGNTTPMTYLYTIANPILRLERRKEMVVGVEGVLLNKSLSFDINYYNNLTDGPVVQATAMIPSIVGIDDAMPWINYNQTRHYGLEVTLGYQNKIGQLYYNVSANAAVQDSRVVKVDEPDYPHPYMSKKGYPSSAIFGLRYTGKFKTDEETLLVPQLYDDELKAGDLKYMDMNDDGQIDDNDKCYIGNSTPKLLYGVNISLKYKGFDLRITGTGRAFYDLALTNSYFWNGWGDNNYSKFVRYNFDNENYPRLTYNKVNNNYQLSDFWLEKGSFFKLQNAELGYQLPLKRWNVKSIRIIRIYARGSNLLTISKIKDVDPESINSGISNYPLFRSFVGGIKFTF